MINLRSFLRRAFPNLEDSALFFLGMLIPIGVTVLVCLAVATGGRGAPQ